MASITSLGVGSGLDLNTIVTQLVALERQPLQQMQSDASALSAKVSLYGNVSSLFSGLQDAANALTNTTFWQKSAVSSSDTGTVAVSADTDAAVGNYAVTVQSLAGNQTLAAGTALGSATDTVGAGTLKLQLGTWGANNTSFSAKSGSSELAITVTDTDTLSSLRDKINNAGAGVTASLVTDATGVRLAIRAKDSGAENGFRVSVEDDDGAVNDAAGLSRFAYDPPSGVTGLDLKQAAVNAKATINGIAVESANNQVSGVVDGLTLTLNQQNTTPVNISVTRDTTAIVAGIKSFADAYNALAKYLSDQTKYDASSKTGGPLQGDSTATALQSQLRSALNTASGASSMFSHLSDTGLQLQRDGTLTVDTTKLTAAATSNLSDLKAAFANSDSTVASNNGFARRYATLASQVLGTDGPVTTRTQSLQKLISKNADDQAKLNDRVDQFQARLVAQYTALDANVAKLNSLSSYVTQQIAQMNRSTS